MTRTDFFETISKFNRDDFRDYLYRYIKPKQKLIEAIFIIDEKKFKDGSKIKQ